MVAPRTLTGDAGAVSTKSAKAWVFCASVNVKPKNCSNKLTLVREYVVVSTKVFEVLMILPSKVTLPEALTPNFRRRGLVSLEEVLSSMYKVLTLFTAVFGARKLL